MRRGLLVGTLSLLDCWNHLSSTSYMSICSGFWNHFILNLSYSIALIILVQFLPIVWIIEFMSPNSWHVFFPFFVCCITLAFPPLLKTFHLFMAIVMLSHYQPPINYRSRNVEGNFTHGMNYQSLLAFSRLGIYISTWKRRGFVFSRTVRWLNSQNSPLLGKIYWNIWLALSLYPREMPLCLSC